MKNAFDTIEDIILSVLLVVSVATAFFVIRSGGAIFETLFDIFYS